MQAGSMINLLSSPASSLHSVAGRRASVVARTHNQRQESALSRVEGQLEWRTATVTQNSALNLDGGARLIHLSISDSSPRLYGRKLSGVSGRQDTQRWIDSYTMAGQLVAIKWPGGEPAKRLYSIASTPYESRRDSFYIDASLIEVVVERGAGDDDTRLADLGPGAELEVSQVLGRGFMSLLNSNNTLQLALEERRPLLCIAVGTRGMVPIRALLSWTPILAHATVAPVTCLYATQSAQSAIFLTEWDQWREAGVKFSPVYADWDVDEAARRTADSAHHAQVVELLDKALFLREGGFSGLAGSTNDVVVLLAGMSGDVASALVKRFATKGINSNRILFADLAI